MTTLQSLEPRRLLAAFGWPDGDFGVGGVVATPLGSGGVEQIEVLSDGRIIAAGQGGAVRFSANGDVDASFGYQGRAKLGGLALRAIASDPQNRVYALGLNDLGTVVTRLTASGKTDASFGSEGSILITTSRTFSPSALDVDDQGRMLVAGTFKTDGGQGATVRVYRITAGGLGDPTFDSDGLVEFNLSLGGFVTPVARDRVTGVRVLDGDRIVVSGAGFAFAPDAFDPSNGSYIPAVFGDVHHAAMKLTANGSPDDGFGMGGIVRAKVHDSEDVAPDYYLRETIATASDIADDGTTYIVGRNIDRAVITRFTSTGGVDYSTADLPPELRTPRNVVAIDESRAVVMGSPLRQPDRIAVAAVDNDGRCGNVVFVTTTTRDGGAAAAFSKNGRLLVGDADATSGNYELNAISVGRGSDPRPDEFAGARANDIAQDRLGRLHVAYYDAATTTLKYAIRDADGRWSGPETVDNSPFAGQYVSLDTDSHGNPAIAYFDGWHGDLKLAMHDGSSWTLHTADSKGSVGLYPSIKFDGSDRPLITYYQKRAGDLRVARFERNSATFSIQTIDAKGDVGRSGSLAASPRSGRCAVAYASTSTGQVRLATEEAGGGWRVRTVAETAGGADFISMAFGHYHEPAISYYDAAKADLKIAYSDQSGSSFSIRTLAKQGAVGLYSQLTFLDYYGQPVVFAYNRSYDRVLRIDETLANTPRVQTAISAAGRYLSVDFSADATLQTAYYDPVSGVLKIRSADL